MIVLLVLLGPSFNLSFLPRRNYITRPYHGLLPLCPSCSGLLLNNSLSLTWDHLTVAWRLLLQHEISSNPLLWFIDCLSSTFRTIVQPSLSNQGILLNLLNLVYWLYSTFQTIFQPFIFSNMGLYHISVGYPITQKFLHNSLCGLLISFPVYSGLVQQSVVLQHRIISHNLNDVCCLYFGYIQVLSKLYWPQQMLLSHLLTAVCCFYFQHF